MNPEDAAQAVSVVEGRPVAGEDVCADTVGRGVSCLQQSPIVPLLPHNYLGLIVSELGDYPTTTHAEAKGLSLQISHFLLDELPKPGMTMIRKIGFSCGVTKFWLILNDLQNLSPGRGKGKYTLGRSIDKPTADAGWVAWDLFVNWGGGGSWWLGVVWSKGSPPMIDGSQLGRSPFVWNPALYFKCTNVA